MKLLVQCLGGWGRIQREVTVKEIHEHKGVFIAIHRPVDQYDIWIASDLTTGLLITSSISSKLVLAKAKKNIDKNEGKTLAYQFNGLKELYNSGPGVDFKLIERIERKCVARGTSSVKTITITGEFADELFVQ
ncbi:hypothetical protein [Lysinibacillus odysseyi]|uniref:Uncharacterized protein n=1 Tax=Lysinibacillus odysseyi 34hs-1 = NBRC 100172 TaxID=1220589 RepID=A0A0A3IZS9_9BACI|nr:hypothetical protein [Lysinibacillus odysseyi]KGR88418.1 hypothetical protein CD32_01795 [Lysinibacillus odysseyi 34hs-1 = NBRC 100172]